MTKGSGNGYKSYVICTSPRSGSTLLCKLLAATGQAGNPASHFHDPSLEEWLRYFALDGRQYENETEQLEAVFAAARKKGTCGTGLFAVRLQRGSFSFFSTKLKQLYPGLDCDVDRFEAAFGKTLFIHLTRPDKVAQAVSLVKATQSGLWHKAPDGTELERLSEPGEPVYDEDEIARQVDLMTDYERQWADWFEVEKIEPLRITYDDLSNDREAVLVRVFEGLGLDTGAARGIDLPVAKLADHVNREWMVRYRTAKTQTSSG